jgi:hypothetical protein
VSEFNRSLPPDNYLGPQDSHPHDGPTPSAELSIVLEPAPDATIGELVRSLVTAIFTTVSGRTSARRKDVRRRNSPGQPHPPDS